MNKILVVGVGSIGQRHLKALIALGEKNIAAFRTKKGKLILDDSVSGSLLCFYDFEEALRWQPTHIIISNPTSLHLEYLARAIETKAKVFVEKPVVSDYNQLISDQYLYLKLVNYPGLVGFNLRYHSLMMEIKSVISANKYGKAYSAYLHVGHYLPFWHPYEDYRNGYVARKDLGGGVLRTLSHEIDLTRYFFGTFKKLFARVDKISNLEIDTDDLVDILTENEYCPRSVIHLDLLSPVVRRFGYIQFEKGLLEYDLIESKIEFTAYDTKTKSTVFDKKEDFNLQYIRQMEHFLTGTDHLGCTLAEGIEVDKVISSCEISNQKGIQLCLV